MNKSDFCTKHQHYKCAICAEIKGVICDEPKIETHSFDSDDPQECPRCGGYGRNPMGVCGICHGLGTASRDEIRQRYIELKASYEKSGMSFTIPKGWG